MIADRIIKFSQKFPDSIKTQFLNYWESKQKGGNEEDVSDILLSESSARLLGFSFLPDIAPAQIDVSAYADYREVFLETNALPLFISDIVLVVAHAEPWSLPLVRTLRLKISREIRFVCTTEDSIERTLAIVDSHMFPSELERRKGESRKIKASQGVANVFAPWSKINSHDQFQLFEEIVLRAHALGASDIHLLFERDITSLRFRIDGVLETMSPLSLKEGRRFIDGMKSLAGMRLSDTFSLGDGGAEIQVPGIKDLLRLRIATQPNEFGENAVVRLLDSQVVKNMTGLPFAKSTVPRVERVLRAASGLFLVTGPTGSGKSTTLYSCLMQVDRYTRSVQTIENPVEYKIPLVKHLEVGGKNADGTPKNFSNILRNLLRADPDVILVGEIRDTETARIALEAANTGHLILSTLHTTDAPSTVMRLVDLGGDPVILEENLLGVVSQRLLPKLCPACKIRATVDLPIQRHMEMYKLDVPDYIFSRNGCDSCNRRGIKGRVPIFEFFWPDDETRPMIKRVASSTGEDSFRNAWARKHTTLAYDGLGHVIAGDAEYAEVEKYERSDISSFWQ